MAIMTIRTTVAFDPATVARWERLTKRWGTSKSETLRRALIAAEKAEASNGEQERDFTGMSPVQVLDWLRENPPPPVPGGWGDDPHRELHELREVDAKTEEERELKRSDSTRMEPPTPPGA